MIKGGYQGHDQNIFLNQTQPRGYLRPEQSGRHLTNGILKCIFSWINWLNCKSYPVSVSTGLCAVKVAFLMVIRIPFYLFSEMKMYIYGESKHKIVNVYM